MKVEKKVEIFNAEENLPTYKIVYSNDWVKGFKSCPDLIASMREKFGNEVEILIKKNFNGEDTIYLPDEMKRHDPKLIEFMEEYVRLETIANSKLEFCDGWAYRIIETDSKFYRIDDNDYGECVLLQDDMVESPNTKG